MSKQTPQHTLEVLKAARVWLQDNYQMWMQMRGGKGCVYGALNSVYLDYARTSDTATNWAAVNQAAIALYPEYRDAVAPRCETFGELESGGERMDYFSQYPALWVNNHLGKEATLQVVDLAILTLEIQLAQVPTITAAKEDPVAKEVLK